MTNVVSISVVSRLKFTTKYGFLSPKSMPAYSTKRVYVLSSFSVSPFFC